jgi:pimeloyl-ACP methyl ester carboxylesterase
MTSISCNPRTAILFVHGFGGAAVSTWESFQFHLRLSPEASDADVWFLQYPSMRHKVAWCGGVLRVFLEDLISKPSARILNPTLAVIAADLREDNFHYRRIIICAHSMGAVVARRAVLDLEAKGWLSGDSPNIQLLLFAPAHKGSNLPMMAASAFGLDWLPCALLVANALRIHYRSLDDLAKGSATLRRLEADSRSLRRRRPNAPHFRATVLHAEHDSVVEQEPFDLDPPFLPVMGRDHRTICKPEPSYQFPIKVLAGLL